MRAFLGKLQFIRNIFNKQKPNPDEIVEEKWVADFGKPKHVHFDIKSESSFDANLRKNLFYSGHSLVLGLKKTGVITWVDAPDYHYRDEVISGTVRIDAKGGYGAGGMIFRKVDDQTYYSMLISSKGFLWHRLFRDFPRRHHLFRDFLNNRVFHSSHRVFHLIKDNK